MKSLIKKTKLELLIEHLRESCKQGKPDLATQKNISYLLKLNAKNIIHEQ